VLAMQRFLESLAWGSRTLETGSGGKDLRAAWSPGQGNIKMQVDGQLRYLKYLQRKQLAFSPLLLTSVVGGFQPQRVVDFSQSAHKKTAQS